MAATVLASCAKNEVFQKKTNQTPVNFGIYVPQATTKAVSATDFGGMTTEMLGDSGKHGFGVFAYYTDNGSYSPAAKPNFMYNQKVNGNGNGSSAATSWTYSPLKYWPNEHGSNAASTGVDKLSFFAYAPYVEIKTLNGATPSTVSDGAGTPADATEGIINITGNDTAGDPILTFQIPSKGAEQIDLLWGVASASAPTSTAQVDPANTITEGKPFIDLIKQTCDGKVKFSFRHALAKLDLKVQAIVDDDEDASIAVDGNTKVYVRKVEILGKFVTKNTLNLNNTTAYVPLWGTPITTNAFGDPAFTFTDGKNDSDDKTADATESADIAAAFVDGAGVTNVAQKLLTNGHEFLIIPTNLTVGGGAEDGFKVRVTYDIETTDANLAGYLTDGTTHGSKVRNVITTKDAASMNFEGGKVYTITLKLGLTSVKMVADVADWGATSNVDVDLPRNVD